MTKLKTAAHEFAYKNYSWLKNALPTLVAVESFERGAKWQHDNPWHDGQGDYLPNIDREVIVLCDDYHGGYKVCFGHRPKQFSTVTFLATGKKEIIEAKLYGNGGWNIPDVKWWLDCDLPMEEQQ